MADVGPVVAGAGGGQGECVDGEGEVVIIGIVHQKSVIDVLLDTFSLVTLRHERTRRPHCSALLHTGRLCEGLVVSLHAVHDDPPLA